MSDRIIVVCPHCRRQHITSQLYVEMNLCPSCRGRYDANDLRLARKSVMAKYVPKRKK